MSHVKRVLGVPAEMFTQIMTRANANSVPEWVVRVILVMLKSPKWHHSSSEEFVDFGRECRSNLWAVLLFLKEVLKDDESITAPWEAGNNPVFSKEASAQIIEMSLKVGTLASIVRMLREEGLLDTLRKEDLQNEGMVLYSVLPAILGPSSWPKCVGLTGEDSKVHIAQGSEKLHWGDLVGDFYDYLGLHDRTPILYGNGVIIDLKLDATSVLALIGTKWNKIPWVTIFPTATIVAEPPVPEKVTVVAKAAAPAEKPKAEVLPQLPEIPDFIQGPARDVLEALAYNAVNGPNDEIGEYIEADQAARDALANVDLISGEIRDLQAKLVTAQGAAETASTNRSAAKTAADASFPARKADHQKFLTGLSAATDVHKATVAMQKALGITAYDNSLTVS